MREIKFRQLTEILQRVGVENQSDQYLTLVRGSFVPKEVVEQSEDLPFMTTTLVTEAVVQISGSIFCVVGLQRSGSCR